MSHSISVGCEGKDHKTYFPKLMWLLRDYTFTHKEGNFTDYIVNKFIAKVGDNKGIMSLFPLVTCCKVAHPHCDYPHKNDEEESKKNSEFKKNINSAISYIIHNIEAKFGFGDKPIESGKFLANLMEKYVLQINDTDPVDLNITWQATSKEKLSNTSEVLLREYQQEFQEVFPVEEATLEKEHKVIYEKKISDLEEECNRLLSDESTNKEIKIEIKENFNEKVYSKLQSFKKDNYSKSEMVCKVEFNKLLESQKTINLKKLHEDYNSVAKGPAKDDVYFDLTKDIPRKPTSCCTKLLPGENCTVICWSPPKDKPDIIKHYEIEISEDENFIKSISTFYSNECTYRVMKSEILLPNTEYYFRICGHSSSRKGEYSETQKIYFPPGKPDRPVFMSLDVIPKNPGKLQARVQKPTKKMDNGAEITGLKVLHNGESSEKLISSLQEEQDMILVDIPLRYSEGEEYLTYQAVFTNEVGDSEPSNKQSIHVTKLIPNRLELELLCAEAREVKIKWKFLEGNPKSIKFYRIEQCIEDNKTITLHEQYKETNCEITIPDLQPCIDYQFRVTACNDFHSGQYATLSAKTPATVPCQPVFMSLNVIPREPDKLQAKIQTPSKKMANGAKITDLKLFLNGDSMVHNDMIQEQLSDIIEICFPLKYSGNEEELKYQAVFCNSVGDSDPSNELSIPVSALVPGHLELKRLHLKAKEMKLEWKILDGHPKSVKFYKIDRHADGIWSVLHSQYENTNITLTNLQPGTAYQFRVTACNDFHSGQYATLSAKTPATVPCQPVFMSLNVLPREPDKLQAKIQTPSKKMANGAKITDLKLFLNGDSMVHNDMIQEQLSDIIEICFPLKYSGNEEELKYQAVFCNSVGDSDPSNELSIPVSALVPGHLELKRLHLKAKEMKLEWKILDGHPKSVKFYKIDQSIVKESWTELYSQYEGTDISLTNLLPGTAYQFRVTACNELHSGPHATLDAKTLATVPCQPEQPTMEIISPEYAYLKVRKLATKQECGSPVNKIIVEKEVGDNPWSEITNVELMDDKHFLKLKIKLENIEKESNELILYRVKMCNIEGPSEPSPEVKVYPGDMMPSPPMNLNLHKKQDNIELVWNEPDINAGSVQHFSVEVKEVNGLNESDRTVFRSEVLNTSENLPCHLFGQNNEYHIRVCAHSQKHSSRPSNPQLLKIKPKCPGQPKPPQLHVKGRYTVALEVQPLKDIPDNGAKIEEIIVEKSTDEKTWSNVHKHDCTKLVPEHIEIKLDNYIEYDFVTKYRIIARNEVGNSIPSDPISLDVHEVLPGPPTNLKVKEPIESDSVTLEWSKPEFHPAAVMFYGIQEKENEGEDWIIKKVLNYSETSATIEELESETDYFFRVCSLNASKKPIAGKDIKVRTKEIKLKKPDKPTLKILSGNKVKVSVNAQDVMNKNVTLLIINEHSEESLDIVLKKHKFETSHNTTEYDVELQDKTDYITIQVTNDSVQSNQSEPAGVPIADITPGPPVNVRQKRIGEDYVEIEWDRPKTLAKAVKRYTAQIKGPDNDWIDKSEGIKMVKLNGSLLILNLKSFTLYQFRVNAINGDKFGTYNETLTFETEPSRPSKPPTPVCHTHHSDCCKAIVYIGAFPEEKHRGLPITGIKIETSIDRQQWSLIPTALEDIGIISTSDMPVEVPIGNIETLEGSFYFRVKMTNAKGDSVPSDRCSLPYSDILPGPIPKTPFATQVTGTKIDLTWEPPIINQVVIDHYLVQKELENDTWEKYRTSDPKQTIDGLKNQATYKFRVCAVNRANKEGEYHEISFVNNEIFPGPPKKIRIDGLQSNALKIRWSEPKTRNYAVECYRVECIHPFHSTPPVVRYVTKNSHSALMEGLESNTNYTVRVTAMNSSGHCKDSSIVQIEGETKYSGVARVALATMAGIPTFGVGALAVYHGTKQDECTDSAEEYENGHFNL